MLINISTPLSYLKIGSKAGTGQSFDPFIEEMFLSASRNIVMVSWSIQILFSILVRHVTIIFAGLNRQMEIIFCPDNSPRLIAMKLETWRHNHVLVCRMVDCINESFGLVPLISIGYNLIGLIAQSYKIHEVLYECFLGDSPSVGYRPFTTTMLMARHLVHLILVIFMPYQMKKEVSIDNLSTIP